MGVTVPKVSCDSPASKQSARVEQVEKDGGKVGEVDGAKRSRNSEVGVERTNVVCASDKDELVDGSDLSSAAEADEENDSEVIDDEAKLEREVADRVGVAYWMAFILGLGKPKTV